jgi:Uncharacterised protein family (UPF0236)
MAPAPPVGRGFFPLDEELALLPGSLTPLQQEHLVHLATWMPFARAAQMLERLLGVQVSEPTVRRQAEEAGAKLEAVQRAKVDTREPEELEAPEASRHVISADGAYVPLLNGEWAEVRTVAIGEVQAEGRAQEKSGIHVSHLSYFSRLTDAATFADLAEVELRRRRVRQAKAVCAVMDGADWLQSFLDLHCPEALRILDFPHAAEHISLLRQAVQQAGVKIPLDLLERVLHHLKHRGPHGLLRLLERLPLEVAEQEGVREQVGYLSKREALMQYPAYRQQGWPIGSGMVESANKVVVQARLKGAGMHWQRGHVNPLLALRNAVCNERWEEAWQEIVIERQQRQHVQRQHRATTRWQQLLASWLRLILRFSFSPPTPTPASKPLLPATPAATLPGSSRPSAYRPWKRSRTIGRCQRKLT